MNCIEKLKIDAARRALLKILPLSVYARLKPLRGYSLGGNCQSMHKYILLVLFGGKMKTRVIIGADVVPTYSNYSLFERAKTKELIGEKLYALLKESDFTILNLETPLCDRAFPIPKNGPNLIAPCETIHGLHDINPHFYTLANNHILDQGDLGLKQTIQLLKYHDISFAGAGNNLHEASQPFIVEKNKHKIGVYCCAEHEFSIAA